MTAFSILLHKHTLQNDVVFGSPAANRLDSELEELIGFFVNPLVLRVKIDPAMRVTDVLAQVRQTTLDAYEHQEVPFERIVEELAPERSLSASPVFQISFGVHNAPWTARRLKGIQVESVRAANGHTCRFDLEVHIVEHEHVTVTLVYNCDLFDRWRIEQLLTHYVRLLNAIAANPEARVGDLRLMDTGEQQQVLAQWNDTDREVPEEPVWRVFEAQADETSDAVALVYERQALTFGELDARANQFARYLDQMGVSDEVRVGLYLRRSPEMLVAILAILKAGGVYVPLDLEYPADRLATMMSDADLAVVITDSDLLQRLPGGWLQPICVDDDREMIEQQSRRRLGRPSPPHAAAYIMYTSGSTGEPKGVVVTHRNIVRLVRSTNYASFGPEEVMLQLAPVAFDASTFEIWGSLLNGGKLVLWPGAVPVLDDLGELIRQERVSIMWLTAGLFSTLVKEGVGELRGVRQLLAGGDVLSVTEVAAAIEHLPGCSLDQRVWTDGNYNLRLLPPDSTRGL